MWQEKMPYRMIADELRISASTAARSIQRYRNTESPHPKVWVRCGDLNDIPNVISREKESFNAQCFNKERFIFKGRNIYDNQSATNINVRNTKGATMSDKSAKKEMWILLILCQMTCLQ